MRMLGEVKEIFEGEKYHQLATSSKDGVPNVCTFGAKYLHDDGTIVIVDNYFDKTLKNILANPQVAIVIRREKTAYQLKGTCKYVTEGAEYEKARQWMKAKGDKYPAKGAAIITVEEIFHSTAGPKAGERL